MIWIPFAAFLFAYNFVAVAGFDKKIKRFTNWPPNKRMKPLDCVGCLSLWTALVLLFLPIPVSTYMVCLFGASFIGYKVS